MPEPETNNDHNPSESKTPSEEFAAYCDAEFERRLNSGTDFDEQRFRQIEKLVMDKLQRLEDEGRA